MSIVSDLLGTIDEARALLDDVGLRPFTVYRRIVTYTGARVGDGDRLVEDTPITVARGGRPKVESLAGENVVAGGVMTKQRWKVGPLTPEYAGGGTEPEVLDPPRSVQPTEVFFVLQGPGLPESGALCKQVGNNFNSPFRYFITIESLGKVA